MAAGLENMMKIVVTGDMHGQLSRFDDFVQAGVEPLSAEDLLIVCGDFGFVFRNNEHEKRIRTHRNF